MEAMSVVPSAAPAPAPEPSPPPSRKILVERLRKAIGALENIPKGGWNEHSQYRYVRVDDIAAAVRRALADAGLVLVGNVVDRRTTQVQTAGGKPAWSEDITMSFILTDGEAELQFSMPGSGQDTGDKALYKAISGARKYALLTLLNLGGDDPEVDSHETARDTRGGKQVQHPAQTPQAAPQPSLRPSPSAPVSQGATAPLKATERQVKAISALGKALLVDEEYLRQVIRHRFSANTVEDLTRSQASQVLDMLKEEQRRSSTRE